MKILPVVVLYNNTLAECESVLSLLNQINTFDYIDCIYVHDNSPSISLDGNDINKNIEIVYNHDAENSGVSKAYNNATKYAIQYGYEWLLLLDQDTILPESSLSIYVNAIINNPNINLFCPILKTKSDIICSPCLYRFHRGFTPNTINTGINSLEKYSPINSCSMIAVSKIIEAGGYNEKAYLDFSDFQFIERLKRIEKKFFVVNFVARQDFSNEVSDEAALVKRFKIYCKCALGCDKKNILDKSQYLGMVFFRAFRLYQRKRNFIFFRIFIKDYLVKN